MSNPVSWKISGSYFEVCSCEAICPCRTTGDRLGGRSTYGVCDFALSWWITAGYAGAVNLAGLAAILAGTYNDDESHSPWRVVLYIDERADSEQHQVLADIFLGRVGGSTLRNFARAIGEVYAVRAAHIELDHSSNHERMKANGYVTAYTVRPVLTDQPVSCGIPGHDRPGQEIVAGVFRVDDPALHWEVQGRCGFATDFLYSSAE